MNSEVICLVGLDWGSSHVRAYAFDAHGRVVAKRASAAGAMTLQSSHAFREALHELVDHDEAWRDVPRIACGMVGARGAWVEAGYCSIGSDVGRIADQLVAIEIEDARPLWVIPGVASTAPDVMRGEETQLLGSGVSEGTVVLPGTHSKWAQMSAGSISSFTTYMTGEMNALIRGHSTVGRILTPSAQLSDAAVDAGVAMVRSEQSWLSALFSFRARAVAQGIDAQILSDQFSAWLIAAEFMHALSANSNVNEVSIIGSAQLAEWYAAVASRFDVSIKQLDADQCVTVGLWRIACAKALVRSIT